jgi:hypothetical protein
MKRNQDEEGKISNNSRPLGTVTAKMVRARAHEIAIINGRSPRETLDSDFDQAHREMTGEDDLPDDERAEESLLESERWDPVPGSAGQKIPDGSVDDEQSDNEKLVQEGMEEAEHDQMIQGTKQEARRDQIE